METAIDPERTFTSFSDNGGAAGYRNIVAVIYHRFNYLTLGSVITVARSHTNKIFVITDGDDPRIPPLARALGAKTFEKAGVPFIKIFRKLVSGYNADVLLALYGDGTHDPDMVPELINSIDEDIDVAIGPNSYIHGYNLRDSIQHLNDRRTTMDRPGALACSSRCFDRLKADFIMDPKSDIAGQFIARLQGAGMKIKHINSGLHENDHEFFSLFRIAVVVPAFNEEGFVGETIKGIPPYVHRIYAIDDGSTDHTWDVICSIRDTRIVPIRHETNKGVGSAIVTGYKRALEDDMDIVAVMAGDNQMDPQQLPRLLMPIVEGRADYTKGNRLISRDFRKGMSQWRAFGNFLLTMLTKIGSGYWHIMDPQNGYTAISRQALEALDLDSIYTYYGYCNDLLIKLNAYGIRALDVAMPSRYGNERSKIKYSRYILKVSPMLFRGFLWRLKMKYILLDFNPLVMFYALSMAMLPVGLIFDLLIFIHVLLRESVSNNQFVLAALITIAGIQFLMFAMLFDMQSEKAGHLCRV